MSSLIIEIGQIQDIKPHDNADALELAFYKGWQCVVRKGQFQIGDTCVYFPPDTLLSHKVGEELNVIKYLKKLSRNYPSGEQYCGRVGVSRLRGTASYGILAHPNSDWLDNRDNIIEYLGISKYEQPEEVQDGDSEKQNPFFHKYTDIENLRNFPDAFAEGDIVVATEKIHGRNCRLGLCYENEEMVWMAGSHNVRRRQYDKQERLSVYWRPFQIYPQISEMMKMLYSAYNQNVMVFGELYGPGMQDLVYGQKDLAFRVFDIAVDTRYLGYEVLLGWCRNFDIPMVPVSFQGAFYWDQLEEHAKGSSMVSPTAQIREGIVIRPFDEQTDFNGRKIYKLINFDYLNRKGGSEAH